MPLRHKEPLSMSIMEEANISNSTNSSITISTISGTANTITITNAGNCSHIHLHEQENARKESVALVAANSAATVISTDILPSTSSISSATTYIVSNTQTSISTSLASCKSNLVTSTLPTNTKHSHSLR